MIERIRGFAWIALGLLYTSQAHAHFKLLKPTSWLTEDSIGAPQKGSPCGPGNARPFIGDDVQPIPASDAVTKFHTGETITVQWDETVYHPGYFRISLARTRAADATTSDFPDPALTDEVACNYDRAAVMTSPHGDVLADGLFMAEAISAENRSLMQEVKLPDEPCSDCTLQVVQVMEGHGASSCYYFHCANIQILPAEHAADGGSAAAAGRSTAPGAGSAGTTAPSSKPSGGCSVADRSTATRWGLLAIGILLLGRRWRRR